MRFYNEKNGYTFILITFFKKMSIDQLIRDQLKTNLY